MPVWLLRGALRGRFTAGWKTDEATIRKLAFVEGRTHLALHRIGVGRDIVAQSLAGIRMKNTPKASITVMRSEGNERFSVFEVEPGVWSVSVEGWSDRELDPETNSYIYRVLWAQIFPSLLEALDGLREVGFLYDAIEVVQSAEMLTEIVKKKDGA